MSTNDLLAACLSKINNAEKVYKKETEVQSTSKLIEGVLAILQKHDYLGSVDYTKTGGKSSAKVELLTHINNCGAIKPRFKVKVTEIERFEERFLPAKDFGLLVLSTPQGLMTHKEAKEKHVGGRLIAYCY